MRFVPVDCVTTYDLYWLQVAPLFAIHDMPKTPGDGEQFIGGPGNQTTRIELQVTLLVTRPSTWHRRC